MKLKSNRIAGKPNTVSGFSMVELMMVVTVSVIILALGIPSFVHAYQTYQLNDAAARVATVLKFTRFEAIRRNVPVNCLIRTVAAPSIWSDPDGDGLLQPTENQAVLAGVVTFSNGGGIPNKGGLAAGVGAGALTIVSPVNLTIVTFDSRGATNPAGVFVLYLQSNSGPLAGYRAVIVLPSGAVQVWSSDTNGVWQQYN